MPALDAITNDKLLKLIGTPRCPVILDNRRDPIRAEDPRLLPGARALSDAEMEPAALDALIANLTGPVIVVCAEGHGRSQGLAALLRSRGIAAEYLDQGHNGWRDAGLPLINADRITGRDRQGRSLWITRSRPKIDRIACPWLIRRFVDPRAVFLYVAPTEVVNVADLLGGMPFDIEGVFWSHRDETCTFDTMLAEFGLFTPALDRLATIVRGADTARPELAPEVPGLLAASLGLSRMYAGDLDQLEAGMGLYDAFYRWCRDATEETHNWPTNKPGAAT
ncbi:chromate resistance protein ChrB domain-containing protein [Albibacillus kandeliae]|uniref:chromate resistance protein ChrB domain-containing protein n=1 Tax=Albibacillus kandeliae TaxID=2174228 RepID=UPI000D69DF45|nr:sulfurtransferase/chromate resistance protein [Albibacillus kandeliae]